MTKKKYVESDEVIGYLYRQDRKTLKNMKIGDALAVVMDNGVYVISMEERDDALSGMGFLVRRLRSVRVEGMIKFSRTKAAKPE